HGDRAVREEEPRRAEWCEERDAPPAVGGHVEQPVRGRGQKEIEPGAAARERRAGAHERQERGGEERSEDERVSEPAVTPGRPVVCPEPEPDHVEVGRRSRERAQEPEPARRTRAPECGRERESDHCVRDPRRHGSRLGIMTRMEAEPDLMVRDDLADFERREVTLQGRTRLVFVAGSGPAVIVMSEMPGIYAGVSRFARRVRDAGFTVWMPQLFGKPGHPPTMGYALGSMVRGCIS